MSNPYEPYQPPGGQQPYGGQPPYGNDPYGAGYGGNPQPAPNDAVSITGFVLSLTCCLSIVGAILGFIGLSRTKDGKRRARWAAISATIIGILGTLAFAGGVVFVVYFAKNTITIDNAEVGQCMDVDTDGDEVSLLKQDCADDHDAQIVYLGTFNEIIESNVAPSNPDDVTDAGIAALVCTTLLEGSDLATAIDDSLGDDVEYGIANEDGNPAGSDKFICYVEHVDGDPLTEKIG